MTWLQRYKTHHCLANSIPEPEDRTLAEISDFQGVGSKAGHGPAGQKTHEARLP